MDRLISAGVAGAGVFGGIHAEKYASSGGVRLAAVYDVDAAAAARLAAKFGAASFLDYDAFLGAIDALTIAAPACAHFELSRRALARGKHVLVEKPIALRLDHADELIAESKRQSVVLQVGHQERFVHDALRVRRSAKPSAVHCRRMNEQTSRGHDVSAVLDLMIHDLDLVRRMGLGDLFRVEAAGSRDAASARLHLSGGAQASFEASRKAETRERRMTVIYDDGRIEIDFLRRTILNSTPDLGDATFNSAAPELQDPLGCGVIRFIQSVRSGSAAAISGEDGRKALEWALLVEAQIADAAASRERA